MNRAEKIENKKGVGKYVPVAFWVFLGLAAVSFVFLMILKKNSAVAEFLNMTTGRAIRAVLTTVFNVFPFSFVELLILASPILFIIIAIVMIKKGMRGLCFATRFFCAILCVIMCVFSFFVFGYEASYYGSTIEENTNVERNKLSKEELYDAAKILLSRAEAELDQVNYLDGGESVMPYSFSEFNKKLNEAYVKFNEKYPAYQKMYSRVKPVMLSEPWTYTHISGLYSFFTGEANLNVNYPDFIIVTSAAHEMSHQRGIGKEDEADFAAFLVCIDSDDPYIRYCGYLEFYRNVVDRLYGADIELWREVRSSEDMRISRELSSFSKFFDKYRENVAATVNDSINNAYIQSHNQPEGVKSYGLVVDLVVSYILYTEQ